MTSLAQLLRWQESQTPPALSMAARNDIFDYAKMLLQPASYQLFLQYSEQLSWTLPQPAPAVLPLPEALQGHGYSQAELQAQAHLSGGSASLWEAVRQTVALLEFDAPRQVMMQQQARAMSFHLGVCARGPMVGICKATPVHRNVWKLLTFFVKHILPEHRYTSLAINAGTYKMGPRRISSSVYASNTTVVAGWKALMDPTMSSIRENIILSWTMRCCFQLTNDSMRGVWK